MNANIVKYITYPLHDFFLKRKTLSILKEIHKSEWLPLSEILDLQWVLLKRLLNHAFKSVPYYRNLFDGYGCNPSKIHDLNDFRSVPVLTKDIIRQFKSDLISNKASLKDLVHASTTGSTGQPLEYYICQNRIAYHNAFEIRGRRWIGIDNFDKKIWLWGRRRQQSKSIWLIKHIRDRLLNKKIFLCDALDGNIIKDFLILLRQYKPTQLYCYAGAIYHIAKYIEDNNIDGSSFNLKGIITTAEVLHEHQRKKIHKVFKCTVANEYGSSDAGLTAQECEHGRLHINAEGVYVEVEKKKNDDFGELLITNLQSFNMPFIRYKIGDIGKLSTEDCPCGRKLPILSKIIGRTMDCLWTKSGQRVDSLVIDTLAEEPGILRFKIHQHTFENIAMELVVNDSFDKEFENWFRNELEKLFKHRVNVTYEYKHNINNTKAGKNRYITTDINL